MKLILVNLCAAVLLGSASVSGQSEDGYEESELTIGETDSHSSDYGKKININRKSQQSDISVAARKENAFPVEKESFVGKTGSFVQQSNNADKRSGSVVRGQRYQGGKLPRQGYSGGYRRQEALDDQQEKQESLEQSEEQEGVISSVGGRDHRGGRARNSDLAYTSRNRN